MIEPLSKRAPEPLPPPPRQRLRLPRPEAPGRPAPLPPPALPGAPLARETRSNERSVCIRLACARRGGLDPEGSKPGTVLASSAIQMRSASTASDRLSPGGASFAGKGRNPYPTVPGGNPRGGEVALTRRRFRVESPLSRRSSRGLRIRGPEHRLSPARTPPAAIARAGAGQTPIQHGPSHLVSCARGPSGWISRRSRSRGEPESRSESRSQPKQRLVRP